MNTNKKSNKLDSLMVFKFEIRDYKQLEMRYKMMKK